MSIKIPRRVIAEMITHAMEEDPDECCGFLVGKGNEVTGSRRIKNTDPNKRSRFTMDGLEILHAQEEVDARGEEFVAQYHSHTYMQAHPSPTDVKSILQVSYAPYQVVLSLVEKTRPIVRAFIIHEDESIEEVVITTDGTSYTTANS